MVVDSGVVVAVVFSGEEIDVGIEGDGLAELLNRVCGGDAAETGRVLLFVIRLRWISTQRGSVAKGGHPKGVRGQRGSSQNQRSAGTSVRHVGQHWMLRLIRFEFVRAFCSCSACAT